MPWNVPVIPELLLEPEFDELDELDELLLEAEASADASADALADGVGVAVADVEAEADGVAEEEFEKVAADADVLVWVRPPRPTWSPTAITATELAPVMNAAAGFISDLTLVSGGIESRLHRLDVGE